jgi:3-methyl-2-oxobutanoate hydroxymethyltransferase
MRVTLNALLAMKAKGQKITALTAYDFSAARLSEAAEIPLLLVGDSLGMVMHGHGTTVPVTLEEMILHGTAVTRGNSSAFIVVDLPFLTYTTIEDATHAAGRVMRETQAQAVKMEGGAHIAPIIRHLTQNGVPVMGHLGFTPQSQHQIGLRVQGKDTESAKTLIEDALALEKAGAFAVVLELIPAPLAAEITKRLAIPTIGIGAGPDCDGQIQVWHDILGLFGKPHRHAKQFADIGAAIRQALQCYQSEVETGTFPTAEHSSKIDGDLLARAIEALDEQTRS